ncbi:UPF0587 protein, partial [Tanacetum coccineum]
CGTIKMKAGKGFPLTLSYNNREKPSPLMTFCCDGVEPIGFITRGLWEGVTALGTPFKDIELKNGTFGYPPEDGEPAIRISNVQFSFQVAR